MKKFLLYCFSAAANVLLTIFLVYILSAIAKILYYTAIAGWQAF